MEQNIQLNKKIVFYYENHLQWLKVVVDVEVEVVVVAVVVIVDGVVVAVVFVVDLSLNII